MARIRTVKPDFWSSPKTAKISRDARLLFLGLLNESDDEGRQVGSVKRISGAVFPNDTDITDRMVDEWLTELARVELICRYEVDGVAYVLIPGFNDHQKVSHPSPSRLPAPPSGNPPEDLPKNSGEPPETFRPDLGKGNGSGKGKGTLAPAKRTRQPDLLWDAVLAVCGVEPDQITNSGRGAYNRAVNDIRQAGGTPDDVPRRAAVYRRRYDATLTPTALAKHWAACGPAGDLEASVVQMAPGTRAALAGEPDRIAELDRHFRQQPYMLEEGQSCDPD